jgi:hypothetical protein
MGVAELCSRRRREETAKIGLHESPDFLQLLQGTKESEAFRVQER